MEEKSLFFGWRTIPRRALRGPLSRQKRQGRGGATRALVLWVAGLAGVVSASPVLLAQQVVSDTVLKGHACSERHRSIWAGAPVDAALEQRLLHNIFLPTLEKQTNAEAYQSAYSTHIAQALRIGWDYDDFYVEGEPDSIRNIAQKLEADAYPNWSRMALSQEFDTLAGLLQQGVPVLAVLRKGSERHMVTLLPGGTQASNNWGMAVPRSLNLSTDPRRNFLGCRMSFAIAGSDRGNTHFYARVPAPAEESSDDEGAGDAGDAGEPADAENAEDATSPAASTSSDSPSN